MKYYCQCKKKGNPRHIDKCMEWIGYFNNNEKLQIVACCCGHGKYPMTIVVRNFQSLVWELLSNKRIPRKTRFYVKDKQGYYYIPEVLND